MKVNYQPYGKYRNRVMEKIVFTNKKEKSFYIQQPKELPTQWEQKMAE
jgi:hypothetical protein